MSTLAVGDLVVVQGPPGEAIGEVVVTQAPERLPYLGPSTEGAKEILREWRVSDVVLIRQRASGGDVVFWVFRHPGGWRDLGGQDLQLRKWEPTTDDLP